MQKLKTLFDISYGTKLDKNKTVEPKSKPVLFVSRTSKNHGIDLICEKQIGILPNEKNTISVPLGGEGRLTANVQFNEYYNGQNVAVLTPLIPMTLNQRIYYSIAIKKNQFRYSAFGREANSTLGEIMLPSLNELPSFVNNQYESKFFVNKKKNKFEEVKYKSFKVLELFEDLCGSYISEEDAKKCKNGDIAFVSSGRFNNGVKAKISLVGMETTIFPSKCLTLAKNGSVGVCFYHEEPVVCTSDVIVLKFRDRDLNKYEGLFFKVLIEQHIFRFNYGRKINKDRLEELTINVPFDYDKNQVDFRYMNKLIKSNSFSNLI